MALTRLAGCGPAPRTGPEPDLVAYIDTLAAVDAHALPMVWVAPGQPPDTDFDALPLGDRIRTRA